MITHACDKYTYRVVWSDEDGEYVGLCAEMPSLSWLDASQAKALIGIVKLVAQAIRDMSKNREEIPTPISGLSRKSTVSFGW